MFILVGILFRRQLISEFLLKRIGIKWKLACCMLPVCVYETNNFLRVTCVFMVSGGNLLSGISVKGSMSDNPVGRLRSSEGKRYMFGLVSVNLRTQVEERYKHLQAHPSACISFSLCLRISCVNT